MNKQVFSYALDDGIPRYADPFAVERVLTAFTGGDPEAAATALASEVPEIAHQATERVKAASAAAFNLPLFDTATGQGTDEETLLRLFNEFGAWRQKKNLTPGNSPTWPPLSGLEVPAPPGGWNQVMNSLMDCGCTSQESATSAPTK